VQRQFTATLLTLGLTGSLLSVGSMLSGHHIVFDLLSHFRLQYIVLILPLLLLALAGKRWLISLVLTTCLCVHLFTVYQSQQRVSPAVPFPNAERQLTTLKVMTYTSAWHTVLSNALSSYPHKLTAPLDNPFGIAMYSRYPFTDSTVAPLFTGGKAAIRATVSISGKHIDIFGVHPPPPISAALYRERNKHLQLLAEYGSQSNGPMVIAGDLNTSPWSGAFMQFVQQGNLFDTRAGKGVFATWPDFFKPLQIPIDYIIVSAHFNVLSMHVSGDLGSDHKTIWATLQF